MNDLGRLGSFGLAAAAALALAVNASVESFHAARPGVVMLVLLLMHLIRFARVALPREALICALFISFARTIHS